MQKKPCASCGQPINKWQKKYCVKCSPWKNRLVHMPRAKRIQEAVRKSSPIVFYTCCDCKRECVGLSPLVQRCPNCREKKGRVFHIVKELRDKVANNTITTPQQALEHLNRLLTKPQYSDISVKDVVRKVILDKRGDADARPQEVH